jgi:hypothetical protein
LRNADEQIVPELPDLPAVTADASSVEKSSVDLSQEASGKASPRTKSPKSDRAKSPKSDRAKSPKSKSPTGKKQSQGTVSVPPVTSKKGKKTPEVPDENTRK